MKVLILAGGYGTRLYPVVKDTPKPLLQIAGRPLINYLMEKVRTQPDLKEIIVVTNDKFYGMFQLWARQNSDFPSAISIINDGTRSPDDRLGSIGDIQYVLQNHAVDDDLLVLGGDNLFDYSLDDYIVFARQRSPEITIGLYDIGSFDDARRFGVVQLGEDGRIQTFDEKPAQPKSSLIAMCSYYLPKESLSLINTYIEQTQQTDKAGDYICWLVEKGDVCGFQFKGAWYDIGSLEALEEAQKKFRNIL